MTNWVAFALVVNAVLVVVLSLARATQSASGGAPDGGAATPRDLSETDERLNARARNSPDLPPQTEGDAETREASSEPSPVDVLEDAQNGDRRPSTPISDANDPRDPGDIRSFSTGVLFANVAATHGTLGAILLVAAWASGIPATALGIDATANVSWSALAVGVALGVALYAVNELLAANLDRVGVEYSENLRGALGPDSIVGWLVLLAVVLPIIAVFEELLFRAALIGAMSAGFGFSPWLLAAASSLAFGAGHGIQGATGMIVTGLLGFVLAAAFILTESLLTVVVAHYLINALEFVVHEWAGIEWAG